MKSLNHIKLNFLLRKKIATIGLFLICQFSLAQTFNVNYEGGISRMKALENVIKFEEAMKKNGYIISHLNVDSDNEYSVLYKKYDSDGSVFKAQYRYYFYESNFEMETIGMVYIVDDLPNFIEADDKNPDNFQLYSLNKIMFVDAFTNYINTK